MSRARQTSTVYVVADSLDQAVEDLTRDWSVERRTRWAIDSGMPATAPLAVEHDDRAPDGMRAALRHARLQAEWRAVAAAIPPDPSAQLADLDRQLATQRRHRTDLVTGRGPYAATPAGDAVRRLHHAHRQHHADNAKTWRDRRHWRTEAANWAHLESAAEATYAETIGPEVRRLDHAISHLQRHRNELDTTRQERRAWLAEHPEAAQRLKHLQEQLHFPSQSTELQDIARTCTVAVLRRADIQPSGHDHSAEINTGR